MDKLKAAVALLKCGKEQGTAFLINRTLAITMSHCVIEAIENGHDVQLIFNNIDGQGEIIITAEVEEYEKNGQVTFLRLNNEIQTDALDILCCEDKIGREERLVAYGYPHVKREEGCIIDIYVNDYLNENLIIEGDVVMRIASGTRIDNFAGMSGSPVFFRNKVIGILIEQGVEKTGNNAKAIDLKMISIKRIKGILDHFNIDYTTESYAKIQKDLNSSKQLREYCDENANYDERKRNYGEKYVVGYSELDSVLQDYEKAIEAKLKNIFYIKNRGDVAKAWEELRNLTTMVRSSKRKPDKILARLYYLQACWYLDDYADGRNAQKYINKVLEIAPDYDCRNYMAKKLFMEGNVIEVKKVLQPIDNVSILNTYLQLCINNIEIEDAYYAFEEHKSFANAGTFYLMSLICILDGEYDIARSYLKKSNEEDDKIPLHIMMEGVILYWEMLPSNMIYGDSMLPSMYTNSMILMDDESKKKFNEIISLYSKAYDLAKITDNIDLQKHILIVWLDTLSISDEYREEGYKVANELMELEPYQCQAVIYYHIKGKEISLTKEFNPSEIVQKKGNNINSMISCVYLFMNKKDYVTAYKKLKEYRFKFEEMHMMAYWFEMAVHCCEDNEQLRQMQEDLKKCDIESLARDRINGMILEALGEKEDLIDYASKLYKQTNLEIDLTNLINCYENCREWENAEYYCKEWLKKFENPMANIKIVRYLALQNKQEECLDLIDDLRQLGKEECLTNEVLFYEVQALKMQGRYDEAIEKGEALWSREVSPKVLFLLAECYYLNAQEQDAFFKLKEGIKKGLATVEVYQMCAEYNKRGRTSECERYIDKALIKSDNNPKVMMWAMNLLYSIGSSEKASKLLVKLQTMDKADCFKTLTFKEAKEWIDTLLEQDEKIRNMYMKCEFPYHMFFDQNRRACYALCCHKLWSYNIDISIGKQLLLTSFGGHNASMKQLKDTIGKEITIDYSSLIHMKHLDILDDIVSCWNKVIISGKINNIITCEQDKCLSCQSDVLESNNRMMKEWKQKSLNYVNPISHAEVSKWIESGIQPGDIVPYELAKKNNLTLISNKFLTDLLEESDKIPAEMRDNVISTYELLTVLERRGDISSDFKGKYRGEHNDRKECELMDSLVANDENLSILVDQNFLREIYEMDGVSIISQKCNIFVMDNVFSNIEENIRQDSFGKKTNTFLNSLKDNIQELKDEGKISYYGEYDDKNKRKNSMFTNDFIDLYHYTTSNSNILICDDRWVNAYNSFNKCLIYSVVDVIELLHEQKIISDEKYINVITQMFKEGYAYIVPPFEYIRLLMDRMSDKKDVYSEIPEELSIMCDYLVYITASEWKLSDEMVYDGVLPESIGYMNHIQRVLIKLMNYLWCTDKSKLWKCQMSNWLLANFSVFSYRSFMNDDSGNYNQNYYEMELSAFLFYGFYDMQSNSYRRDYYDWLFKWYSKNIQWKNGLEDQVIELLAEIICDIHKNEADTPYKGIGIGVLLYTVTDDMPEYYKNLIRNNKKISPIIGKFEDRYVYLGKSEIVPRTDFNQWLDYAIKHGLGNAVKVTAESSDKVYEVTFVINELFHQGFKIKYIDENGNTQIKYFRIDNAMLCSTDIVLRTKGLLALESFIPKKDLKEYQNSLNRKNWDEIVDKIKLDIKNREDYIIYIICYMLENKINMFSEDDLFPESTKLFETVIANNSQDDIFEKMIHWMQDDNQIISNIFLRLAVFIFNSLKRRKVYSEIKKHDVTVVAFYFADIVMMQILRLNQAGKLKYTLQELSDLLIQLNKNIGVYSNSMSDVFSEEENGKIENEIKKFFDKKELQSAKASDVESICEKMLVSNENLQSYVPTLKGWIIEQFKSITVDEEDDVLKVMMGYACITNTEDLNQVLDCYIDLWEEIINLGDYFKLSRTTIYKLREYITSLNFEQGIRFRKIIEKIGIL